MITRTKRIGCWGLLAALLPLVAVQAQQAPAKRLYCWDEGGRRVCADALPPEAASRARDEFSAQSGRRTGEVARSPTGDERAAAAAQAELEQAAAAEEAAQRRRDLAMVESYMSEADLQRAYGERIALVEASIKGSTLGEANLRASLVTVLGQAADLELAGTAVPQARLDNIRHLQGELDKQIRILRQQRIDRSLLDAELADALQRYRALKGGEDATATTAPPPAATP